MRTSLFKRPLRGESLISRTQHGERGVALAIGVLVGLLPVWLGRSVASTPAISKEEPPKVSRGGALTLEPAPLRGGAEGSRLRGAARRGRGRALPREKGLEGAGRCQGITLPERGGGLVFRPGEELAYELTVSGIYVGRFETKVGRPRAVDGRRALSLFGRARTNSFASTFKHFVGRYMTLVDPGTLRPIGARAESTYGDDRRWERTRFSNSHKSVAASFLYQGKEGQRSYEGGDPLTDVLTMLYFARTRELSTGAEACQEVYGARWLWRMDARVRGMARVATPVGEKDAIWVSTTFQRSPHPDVKAGVQQRYEMDVYFAKDSTQAPLFFVIRQGKLTAEGRLVRWSLEGEDERAWEF